MPVVELTTTVYAPTLQTALDKANDQASAFLNGATYRIATVRAFPDTYVDGRPADWETEITITNGDTECD